MNPRSIIERLVELAPPLLAAGFRPDCCIAATRVAISVLAHYRIKADPQPTTLFVDCVTSHPSPWFVGQYGFVLRNPQVLPFRPCKGKLGFFKV